MYKYFLVLVLLTSCTHKALRSDEEAGLQSFPIQASQPFHKKDNTEVALGGLSDLVYSPSESTWEVKVFYTLTDRGPNKKTVGSKAQPQRPFVAPEFTPQIVKLEYSLADKMVRVVDLKRLRKANGSTVSGLPNVDMLREGKTIDEKPIDEKGQPLAFDPWGLDPEGLARDDQGNFWIAEEYGPSVLKVTADGQVLKRWYPKAAGISRGGQAELPTFLAKRRLNRGFEAAVWIPSGKLLLFLQSEIPGSSDKKWAPVIEFDTRLEKTTGVYFYPLSDEGGKIGGVSLAPSGQLFLLEQNGETGTQAWQKVFELHLTTATNVLAEAKKAGIDFKVTDKIVPLAKNEFIDLSATGLQFYEKLEGISQTSEKELFIINDNDFGVHGATGDSSKSYLFRIKRK